MSTGDIEDFLSDCEEKLYGLHANCLSHANPPPISVLVSNEETYSGGPLEKWGIDTLGLYGKGNEITILERNIGNFARHSGLDQGLIRQVVLIHETAHSVTHLGNYEGKIWEEFWAEKNSDQVEHYAQLATWLYIKKYGAPELMETFEAMSRQSPPKYRTWEESVTNHAGKVDEVLADYETHLLLGSGRRPIDKNIIQYPLEE
jgi:hypothetical protein